MDLIEAAKAGDYEKFCELAKKEDANVHFIDREGLEAIMHAAVNGHLEFMIKAFENFRNYDPTLNVSEFNYKPCYFDNSDYKPLHIHKDGTIFVSKFYKLNMLIMGVLNGYNYHEKSPEFWSDLTAHCYNVVANVAFLNKDQKMFEYFALEQGKTYLVDESEGKHNKDCLRFKDTFYKEYNSCVKTWFNKPRWFLHYYDKNTLMYFVYFPNPFSEKYKFNNAMKYMIRSSCLCQIYLLSSLVY